MGRSKRGRQGVDERAIVAFDFDGTLSFRDSFMAFLAWRAGALGFGLGLVRLLPAALAYLVHRDRGRLKGAAVLGAFRGALPADTDALVELMVRLSLFAADYADEIAEIDLNPVIVHAKGQGVSLVDALIVKQQPRPVQHRAAE